jgi:hypothetical protein
MNLPGVRCSRFALPSFRRKRSRQVPRHSKLEFASALSERSMCLRDCFRIPNGLAHHWIPISVKPLELPLRLLSDIQNAFTSHLLFWWLMRLLKLGLADPDDADPPPYEPCLPTIATTVPTARSTVAFGFMPHPNFIPVMPSTRDPRRRRAHRASCRWSRCSASGRPWGK